MASPSARWIRRIPRNRGIALLDQAPRNARGLVEYRSDFVLLRPADPAHGNGRLLYEVNNRGRIMLFANLCAGAAGNQPQTAGGSRQRASRCGWASRCCGPAGIPGAPKATGLSLDVPPSIDGHDETDPRGIRFRHATRRA